MYVKVYRDEFEEKFHEEHLIVDRRLQERLDILCHEYVASG